MGSPDVPSYRQRIGYHAALLGGFALIASTGLVLGNLATENDISERHREDLQKTLQQVIPAGVYDNDLLKNSITLPLKTPSGKTDSVIVYRATKYKQVSAVAFQVTAYGYAGAIDIILGLNNGGQILGVRVLAHKETPGLGDKIEVNKSDWITGFNGLSTENTPDSQWRVKKDGGRFDQFTGATITPRAVVKGVYDGLMFFEKFRETILDIKSTPVK